MKVLKVSFYVLKFMNIVYEKTFKKYLIKVNNIFNCEFLWLKDVQYIETIYQCHFDHNKNLLNLFIDNQGFIRSCLGLPDTEKFNFHKKHSFLLPSSN